MALSNNSGRRRTFRVITSLAVVVTVIFNLIYVQHSIINNVVENAFHSDKFLVIDAVNVSSNDDNVREGDSARSDSNNDNIYFDGSEDEGEDKQEEDGDDDDNDETFDKEKENDNEDEEQGKNKELIDATTPTDNYNSTFNSEATNDKNATNVNVTLVTSDNKTSINTGKQVDDAKNANATTVIYSHEGDQQQNKQPGESTKETQEDLPPPKPHPHAGAKDTNNQWGYIPDVTLLRQQHLQTYGIAEYPILDFKNQDKNIKDYVCKTNITKGWEGKKGYELMQKIQIDKSQLLSPYDDHDDDDDDDEREGKQQQKGKNDGRTRRPKVLCAIYTYDKNHPRIDALSHAWGWKCDGFFAASTLTNSSIGTINLPHYGKESYNNMWQKTRSIWAFIYDNYMNDFDYFWLGGDDYYLIVENLIKFLGTIDDDKSEAKLISHQIPKGKTAYCGGGPGYVLNRIAVQRFVEEALPTCNNETITSAEDRFLSNCMNSIGIQCETGIDDKGQLIFTGMDPNFMATFKGDKGFFKAVYEHWAKESGSFKWGKDLVSEDAIGFHNLRYPAFMLRIYAIFHPEVCPTDSVLYKDLKGNEEKIEKEEIKL